MEEEKINKIIDKQNEILEDLKKLIKKEDKINTNYLKLDYIRTKIEESLVITKNLVVKH